MTNTVQYRVERHSGRTGAKFRLVYSGGWENAEAIYEDIRVNLRQGTVQLRCSCGDILRSTSAPRLRSRW